MARSLMTIRFSGFGSPMRTRTNWPGMSLPSGFSKTARTPMVPLAESTWLSMRCRVPLIGVPSSESVPISTGICSSAGRASVVFGSSESAFATVPSLALKLA
ncbi:hypothetical protein D3C87_1602230 [compost metagenome]